MDELSDEFKNWPDRIVNLGVTFLSIVENASV